MQGTTSSKKSYYFHNKYLCIVNPNAGSRFFKKKQVRFIHFLKSQPNVNLLIWEIKQDLNEIKNKIQEHEYIIVIGGDGTVNEISKFLIGTNKKLGIIPLGSGNGLARTLGIPLNPYKAWAHILNCNPISIDVGFVNDYLFLCTSGIGFDAEVAHLFNQSKNRGLWMYLKVIAIQIFIYKSKLIEFTFDNKTIKKNVFLFTCANAGQYGNNFYIAPNAKIDDGNLDLVVIPKLTPLKSFLVLFQLIIKSDLHNNYLIQRYRVKRITVSSKQLLKLHIDGDSCSPDKYFLYTIKPSSLLVLK